MAHMPLFSIIVVHFQGTISRDVYLRGINSIQQQTFSDYELLVYHDGPLLDTDNVIVFPIILNDHQRYMHSLFRLPGSGYKVIVTGNPPLFSYIDCMQLVMKRELWLKEGGWYDKRETSDGLMYEKFAVKYGY